MAFLKLIGHVLKRSRFILENCILENVPLSKVLLLIALLMHLVWSRFLLYPQQFLAISVKSKRKRGRNKAKDENNGENCVKTFFLQSFGAEGVTQASAKNVRSPHTNMLRSGVEYQSRASNLSQDFLGLLGKAEISFFFLLQP